MIRMANESDFSALKYLWHEVFGDSYDFIDAFFAKRYESAAVFEKDSVIVSALHLLRCECFLGGKEFTALYIYAAATLKEHRSNGYMRELISWVAENAGCDCILLVPAEKSLFGYYEKFGFLPFGKSAVEICRSRCHACELKQASGDEIFAIREKTLSGSQYVGWSEAAVGYAADIAGETLTNGSSYAMMSFENGTPTVLEAMGEGESLQSLLSGVAKRFGECKAYLPCAVVQSDGKDIDFVEKAMILPLNDRVKTAVSVYGSEAYFGLSLE